jgi:hypothetical protein
MTRQLLPVRREYKHYRTETYKNSDGTDRAYHLWSQESGRYALVYPAGEYGNDGVWRAVTRVLIYHDGNLTASGADLVAQYARTEDALALAKAWVIERK